VMAAANIAGSLLGARMAISRGVKFIRALFLIVVAVLVVKLGVDVVNENF
ncbi:MAG: sulfite exporter TauE/SafE family protein, partial [Leucobacter sp.]|nr:sulfite exporter TauE/SafE family protein [Leucobacter sp.]